METVPAADYARTILDAHERRRSMPPLTGRDAGLDLPAAYRVAAQVRHLRAARGERAVGRKIGFTNTTTWETYGVRAPIWGTVYDTTVREAGLEPLSLAAFVEPRIEPEVVFGLARTPEPGMDAHALFGCLDWAALGFEIVQSLFPGWRFAAADAVAAFGLHGTLAVGTRVPVPSRSADAWVAALADFDLALTRDGDHADSGRAANVLGGGPLAALAHLVDLLANDPAGPLAAGEIVTTGTLTRILPVAPGQVWRAQAEGVGLPGLTLALS